MDQNDTIPVKEGKISFSSGLDNLREAPEKLQEDTIFIKEEDYNTLIVLDLRGKKLKTYRSTILGTGCSILINMIGGGEFKGKPTNLQADGSYFIDCDKGIFEVMLGYIETGFIPHMTYNTHYLKKIFESFGIGLKLKKHETLEDKRIKHQEKTILLEYEKIDKIISDGLDEGVLHFNLEARVGPFFKIIQKVDKKRIPSGICKIEVLGTHTGCVSMFKTQLGVEDYFKNIHKQKYNVSIYACTIEFTHIIFLTFSPIKNGKSEMTVVHEGKRRKIKEDEIYEILQRQS